MKDRISIRDIAVKFGVAEATVAQYRWMSNPGQRYASNPFPKEDGTYVRSPFWMLDRWDEISAWWESR